MAGRDQRDVDDELLHLREQRRQSKLHERELKEKLKEYVEYQSYHTISYHTISYHIITCAVQYGNDRV
jgi:hypothetical protein